MMIDRRNSVWFHYREGLLYRTWRPQGSEEGGVKEAT